MKLSSNHKFAAKVSYWGWSQPGDVRLNNQDNFLNWPERLLWVVADGVAHDGDGAWASRLIMEHMLRLEQASSMEELNKDTAKIMDEVNAELWRSQVTCGVSASTVVILAFWGHQVTCWWAGDSRCYLLRGGNLYQCTKDHSLKQEHIDKGLLTKPEAERMLPGHVITRAVGVEETLDLEKVAFQLEPGDRFLLCTDGFFRLLSSDEICRVMRQAPDARAASIHFQDLVLKRHQPDNLTQISIFVSAFDGQRE